MIRIRTIAELIVMLKPYIDELDKYPKPNRIDFVTGSIVEYGNNGDQHCPTIPCCEWDALLAVEPFESSPEWAYLRELRREAIGVSREIPGAWLRAAYNQMNKRAK